MLSKITHGIGVNAPPARRDAASIWRQQYVPVLYRPDHGELLVKTPFSPDIRAWLRGEQLRKPVWNPGYRCWEVPRCWFEELIWRLLDRYRWLYVIQPYREKEICAPACWNARGHTCVCSCMGENHGLAVEENSWRVVDDTFAVRWGTKQLGCRLFRRGDDPRDPTRIRREFRPTG
jgi:hypothetical protein